MKTDPAMLAIEDYEGLVRLYGDRIFRFCYRLTGNRHDAEDLTQEVFLAAQNQRNLFGGRSSMATYLYRIALFKHRATRKRKESLNISLTAMDAEVGQDDSAEHVLRWTLEKALRSLPPSQSEAFVLVKVEGLSIQEAARAQRVPAGTVKFRVHRAVHRLQILMAESLNQPSPLTQSSPMEANHAL